MYRLYGEDVAALRLYGLGELAGVADRETREKLEKQYGQSSDWLSIAAAAETAEEAITGTGGTLAGLGVALTAAAGLIGAGLKVGGLVSSVIGGRKARAKAEEIKAGKKMATQDLAQLTDKAVLLLGELARLGLAPRSAPDAAWYAAWLKHVQTLDGKASTKYAWSRRIDGAKVYLDKLTAKLRTIPAPQPTAAPAAVTAGGVPAASAAAGAAPAQGSGGALAIGAALLAAKLLLGG